jgi:hypothetical protein
MCPCGWRADRVKKAKEDKDNGDDNIEIRIRASGGTPVSAGQSGVQKRYCVQRRYGLGRGHLRRLQPCAQQLVAVVSLKQTTGYQGGLCLAGSTEYVRFFVDWGAGLTNVGLASFAAHDIPDVALNPSHPIQYMVQLAVDDATHQRLCNSPVLPQVRATLPGTRFRR